MENAGRGSAENLHGWFGRLVDKYCQGEPLRAGIEENIALMANFRWEKGRLMYASVSTLITGPTLEDYYLAGGGATYLRLDLNYKTLGEPFSHPLAHIHVGDADSPRFALDGGTSGNVVMDFLEFIYRHYAHERWLRWVRRQWLPKDADQQRIDQFDRIVKAFRESEFHILRDHAHEISRIKHALREAKDSLFDAHMDGLDRIILEYPLAH